MTYLADLNRHPLTLRMARTLRETRRDPGDYWEGPHERPMLLAATDRRRRRDALAAVALVVASVLLALAGGAL
jgi:hypothetical protein